MHIKTEIVDIFFVQPTQGHLEHLEHGINGFAIDFTKENIKENIEISFNSINKLNLENISSKINNISFGNDFHNKLIFPALLIENSYIIRFLNLILFLLISFFCIPLSYFISGFLYKDLFKKTNNYIEKKND